MFERSLEAATVPNESTTAPETYSEIELGTAVVRALDKLGADCKGRDGMVGYLIGLARKHPVKFVMLLDRAFKDQIPRQRARRYPNNGYLLREDKIRAADAIVTAAALLGKEGKAKMD